MKRTIAIIDGYNVIHRSSSMRRLLEKSLAAARKGLLDYCGRWLGSHGEVSDCLVVFDGDSSVMPGGSVGGLSVRAVFTRTKEDADDRILDIVRESPRDCRYLVVSSDNIVSGNARGLGAKVMSADDFLKMPAGRRPGRGLKIDARDEAELSPVQEREINESLRREWGLD